MIYLNKERVPKRYYTWYKRNKNRPWSRLHSKMKNVLRNLLLRDQGYVCCFCGTKLGRFSRRKIIQMPVQPERHNIRLAHITPRSHRRTSELDYRNICASCSSDIQHEKKSYLHCDLAQGSRSLPISPLQQDCLKKFHFDIEGYIRPHHSLKDNERGKAFRTIEILNLNSPDLINKRLATMEAIEEAFDLALDHEFPEEEYQSVYKALISKDKHGAYNEFYFIVIAEFKRD